MVKAMLGGTAIGTARWSEKSARIVPSISLTNTRRQDPGRNHHSQKLKQIWITTTIISAAN